MVPNSRPDVSAEDQMTKRQDPSGGDRHQAREPQKVRQGEIVLKKPVQRWIFFGGVVAAAIFGIVLVMLAGS